jgi:hypothetical protein
LRDYVTLFPESKVCKFVGLSSFKTGSSSVIAKEVPSVFTQFLIKNEEFDLVSELDLNKVMVRGGVSAILENLLTMSTDNVSKFTYDDLINAYERRGHLLKLPFIGSINKCSIDKVRINKSAYSGFISSLISGRSRASSFSFSYAVAKTLFEKMLNSRISAIALWTFGTRPKLCDLEWDEKRLKARPIALCDSVINLVCSAVSQPIFFYFKRLEHSEMFMGKSLGYNDINFLSEYLDDDNSKSFNYYSPDWSSFDNHVYEEVIIVAFMIWRQCFGRSFRSRNVFFFIITSFIDKFILIDPGFIVKIMKGIPSGHPFTSMIGSMVNWLIWSSIICKYVDRTGNCDISDFKIIVSGDDTILRTPADVDEDILMEYVVLSGMKCDDLRGSGTEFWSTSTHLGCHLLRRHFYEDHSTIWTESYIYNKLMYQEDFNVNYDTLITQAVDYYINMSYQGRFQEIMVKYIYYLYKRMCTELNIKDPEYSRAIAKLYTERIRDERYTDKFVSAIKEVKDLWQVIQEKKISLLLSNDRFIHNNLYFRRGVKRIVKQIRNRDSVKNICGDKWKYRHIWGDGVSNSSSI